MPVITNKSAGSAGGSGLPSPYTATVPGSGEFLDGLLITGPSGAYTAANPPSVVVRGRDNTDTTDDKNGGDALLVGGDLAAGNTGGGQGGNASVRGGNGSIAGAGGVTGGLTTFEGGSAGGAAIYGRDGYEHATLTNVIGGSVGMYGGDGKGAGYGGGVGISAGDGAHGGEVAIVAGATSATDDSAGGNVTITGGANVNESGGGVVISGASVTAAVGNTRGGEVTINGGSGGNEKIGGDVRLTGGEGTSPGRVLIFGGAFTDGTDEPGGDVLIKGGGNANYGGNVYLSGATGLAGLGGSVGLYVGLGTTANNGAIKFGSETALLSHKTFSNTFPIESQTTNATPATVFTESPANHQLITIVSVSVARTTSAGDGGLVVRRSTWRNNGGTPVQIGTTKALSETDEDNGFSVTHTYGSNVDVKAVGKASTTVEWRHTIQVIYTSVGS